MAHEARMEAWFADPQASRPKENARKMAERPCGVGSSITDSDASMPWDRAEETYALDIAFYGSRCS